jgi:hypothetical protein
MHTGNVDQAETWTAETSPHILPNAISVNATITIEPCAVVKIGADRVITVRTGGSIVANGKEKRPVTIEQKDPGKPWSQIRTIGGKLSLAYTQILGGGAAGNAVMDTFAALDIRSDQSMPPADVLFVDHVLIKDSASMGVLMRENGQFSAGSKALTITGSKHFPIHTWANLAGSIPEGTYTGNARDEITIAGSEIDRDMTIYDRGVPYHIGDSLTFGQLRIAGKTSVATLTIMPNVKLRFKEEGALFVQYTQNDQVAMAALVAVGTADKPIIFTSAEDAPAAGNWLGVHFNGRPHPNDKLDFVRIEYAGGESVFVGSSCYYPSMPLKKNDAAIRIFGEPQSSNWISNVTVVASGKHGVDRGWKGTNTISFLGNNNDFSGVAHCKESYPTPTNMACPDPPPCP